MTGAESIRFGRRRRVEVRFVAQRGKGSHGTLYYGSGKMIVTDRKKAEAEIRELNLLLEQKVRERTAELMRSNSDLAQFAYVASHQIEVI